MEDKIYIVEGKSGGWDDHFSWIDGVYKKPEDAEERKLKMIAEHKIILNSESPIKGLKIDDVPDDISEKDMIKFGEWQERIWIAKEFKGCVIREFKLK